MSVSIRFMRWVFLTAALFLLAADYLFGLSWLPYAILIFLILFYLLMGIFRMDMNVFMPVFTKVNTDRKEIAITFDDGPHPNTLKVLEVLEKFQVKAGFFCIGNRIQKHQEIFKKIAQAGHTIGNHSYSHDYMLPFFSEKKLVADILQAESLITGLAGYSNKIFRPPFGVTNPTVARVVARTGLLAIGWNLRSFDTIAGKREKLIGRILRKIKPGTVLLLHDDREGTAEILETILLYCKKAGFAVVDIKSIYNLK